MVRDGIRVTVEKKIMREGRVCGEEKGQNFAVGGGLYFNVNIVYHRKVANHS